MTSNAIHTSIILRNIIILVSIHEHDPLPVNDCINHFTAQTFSQLGRHSDFESYRIVVMTEAKCLVNAKKLMQLIL